MQIMGERLRVILILTTIFLIGYVWFVTAISNIPIGTALPSIVLAVLIIITLTILVVVDWF